MKHGLLVNRRLSLAVTSLIATALFLMVFTGVKRFQVWAQITTFYGIKNDGSFASITDPRAIKNEIEMLVFNYDRKEFEDQRRKWQAIQPGSDVSREEKEKVETELLGGLMKHFNEKQVSGLKSHEPKNKNVKKHLTTYRARASASYLQGYVDKYPDRYPDKYPQRYAARYPDSFVDSYFDSYVEIYPSSNEDAYAAKFDEMLFNVLDEATQLASRYAHLPRALIMYPIIDLGAKTKVNIHIIFSLFGILALLFIAFCLNQTMRLVFNAPKLEASYLILMFFAILGMLMNGRMLFGLMATTMLLWLHYRQERAKVSSVVIIGTQFTALWFSSVSTGLFGGMFLATFGWAVFFSRRHRVASLVVPLLVSPYFIVAVIKNLAFYDYNILALFYKHGFVQAFGSWKAALAGLGAIVTILTLRRWVLPSPFFSYPLAHCGVIFAIACFGHTTASAAIPAVILLSVMRLREIAPGIFNKGSRLAFSSESSYHKA